MDLREKINELFNNTPDYINGVSFGFKKVDNKETSDLAIIFHINKKKSLQNIPSNEIIPKIINIDGKDYLTDIIEDNIGKNLGCYNISENSPSTEVLQHRIKHRPIKGGIVITSTSNCGFDWEESDKNKITPYQKGTLGCIVVDNYTNTLVGLTAGHILAKEISSVYDRNNENSKSINIVYPQKLNILYENALTSATTSKTYNQEIYQFNESSGIDITSNDSIGIPKRYWPISISQPVTNFMDAGIFTLKKNVVNATGSDLQLGLNGTLNMSFATEDEIYDIFVNQYDVYSAGRTTGPKGPGCGLKIKSIYTSKVISGYYFDDNPYPVEFNSLIGFQDNFNSTDCFREGDSGGILYSYHSGKNKIVGLVFAGSSGVNNYGYASDINKISGYLGISPWTGSVLNFDNINYKKGFIDRLTGSGIQYISGNNYLYSEAGFVSNFIAPVNESNIINLNTTINNDGSITVVPIQNISGSNDIIDENTQITDKDIYLYSFSGFPMKLAYSVAAEGVIIDSNFNKISSAQFIYKIENIESTCCPSNSGKTSQSGFNFDPTNCVKSSGVANILRGYTSTGITDSFGQFRIESLNTQRDAQLFRIKILDIIKNSYSFKPDLSSKNELYICARDVDEAATGGDPLLLPSVPMPGGGPLPVLMPGGPGPGPGGGYASCCDDPNTIKNNLNYTLNCSVYCDPPGKRTRLTIYASAVITVNPITCSKNVLYAYFELDSGALTFPMKEGFYAGRIEKGVNTQLFTKKIKLTPSQARDLLDRAKSNGGKTFMQLTFKSLLNSTPECQDQNIQKNFSKFIFSKPAEDKKYINWNGKGYQDADVGAPHCVGDAEGCTPGKKCPAKCCDCCKSISPKSIGLTPIYITVYKKGEFKIYRKPTSPPCPDVTFFDQYEESYLYSCPYDCPCGQYSSLGVKTEQKGSVTVSCEQGFQPCYRCDVLEDDCTSEYYYLNYLSSELPLSLEDLVNQNLNI